MVFGLVWFQEQLPKRCHVFKREWTTLSQYDNNPKFHSQHNWGNLHDHVMSMRNFTLIKASPHNMH